MNKYGSASGEIRGYVVTCSVTCRGCGDSFLVHPLSNALAPDANLCAQCRMAKQTLAQLDPPVTDPRPSVRNDIWKVLWRALMDSW